MYQNQQKHILRMGNGRSQDNITTSYNSNQTPRGTLH